MNKTDKIKALLADPSVDQVSVTLKNLGCGEISIDNWNKIEQAKNVFSSSGEFLEIISFDVKFHDWQEIKEGDRVMTRDGAAVVRTSCCGPNNYYWLNGSSFCGQYMRHELALLERGGDSE